MILHHPLPNRYLLVTVSEATVSTATTFVIHKIPADGKVQVARYRRRQICQQLLARQNEKWNSNPLMSDLAALVRPHWLGDDLLWPDPAWVADLDDPVRAGSPWCRGLWHWHGRLRLARRRHSWLDVITRWVHIHWWRHRFGVVLTLTFSSWSCSCSWLTLAQVFSLQHTHTGTLRNTHTQAHSHTLRNTHTQAHSHTLRNTHTHSHTGTLTHTQAHSHTGTLSCTRLLTGRMITLWVRRPLSVSQHGQLSHPSLRGR